MRDINLRSSTLFRPLFLRGILSSSKSCIGQSSFYPEFRVESVVDEYATDQKWMVEEVDRRKNVLDNGSSRVLRATYVCGPRISVYVKEWRGRIAPSTRIEFSARYRNRRLKCSARVLGLEQPRTKLSRCVFAPPYHARAIDPGFVFGFPSFVFRSSSAAFDSAGREKRLPVILLQRQSFAAQRDFTFPPKLRMELVAIGNDHNKFREMGGKKCSP